jgi:GNAT superfamily N-acetyltransferase
MKWFDYLAEKSPVKFRKRKVFKLKEEWFEKVIGTEPCLNLKFRKIEKRDVVNDPWLSQHEEVLLNNLKAGHSGLMATHIETGDCIGFGWTAIGSPPTNGIPAIPKVSAWLFGGYIREEYRGNGYQKVLQQQRIFIVKNRVKEIFIDVMPGNIPATKNIKSNGFVPWGVYYILIFGIRRYRYLHFTLSFWKGLKYPRIT